MAKEVVVTREGYNKLEQELENLRTVKRKEVADKIKVARGYGDLSENAEGDDLEDAEEYDLTGSTEADMDLNRISDESPVGAALIGCKVGDSVDVTLPNGNIITYKLLEVSRSK